MTLKQQNKQLATIFSIIALSTIAMTLLSSNIQVQSLVTDSTTSQNRGQYTGAPIGAVGRPLPEQPFSIAVNGHEEPISVPINRGESVHLNLNIDQKVAGTIGNINVYDATMPECGTSEPPSKCANQALITSLSKNSVSKNENLILKLTAPKNLAPGVYSYNVSVDTMMVGEQETTSVGYVAAFTVEVQ